MSRLLALVALVIAILSIALNVLLIIRLDRGRQAALAVIDHTSERLGVMSSVSISQTVRINRSFSVSGQMPFNQEFTVPISMMVPISMAMNVNVTTPLGPMNMPVNVNTSVPFKMQVPVTINRSIPYSMTVPIDIAIPVELPLGNLGLEATIKDTQDELLRLRGALQ